MGNNKKTDKRSVSLSLTTLAEINRRSPGKSAQYFCAPTGISPVIDRGLFRLFELYEETRPSLQKAFASSDLDKMAQVWLEHGEPTKSPVMTKNLLTSALKSSNLTEMVERIEKLSSIEIYSLIDLFEESTANSSKELTSA